MTKKSLTTKWLNQFKKASQIVRTGRDANGNYYNAEFGQLNQAAWIGEHAHLLIDEIERLRRIEERFSAYRKSHP